MARQATGRRRPNLLQGRELVGSVSEVSEAPAEALHSVLVDLSSHLDWGGRRRSKGSRLLTLEAPDGRAAVGTEFSSTGEDSMCRMDDRSVVTEVTTPSSLEFVTESTCEFKRSGKRADWTIVHRYDVEPDPRGCRVTYTHRAVRVNALPGPLALFRVPGLRRLALAMSMAELRGGMRNLLQMAEERAEAAGRPATKGAGS
jgi:hypothetical protein